MRVASIPVGDQKPAAHSQSGRPGGLQVEVRGTTIGRYIIIDVLGAGGMGIVYSAFDPQLDRKVAIKVLHSRPTEGEQAEGEVTARLLREAQAMARLSHPNVVSVHDVGTVEGRVFLAMEYVDGGTLRDWCKTRHSWRDALELLKAAGRGLSAAHAASLVHRDFKPDNVLVGSDGRVRVTDFGIACARATDDPVATRVPRLPATSAASGRPAASLASITEIPVLVPVVTEPHEPTSSTLTGNTASLLGTPLTMTGSILGTVGYLAPEQAFGGEVDARSDQFSFCVSLYIALYGTKPFAAGTLEEYLNSVGKALPPPPEGRDVPAWIRKVLARGLSENPEQRFASMDELLAALAQDPTRRQRWYWWGSGVALVCAAFAVPYAQHRSELRARCELGAELVRQAWHPEVRTQVHSTLTASGIPVAADVADRVQARLDDYASQWAAEYRTVSEATLLRGLQAEPVMVQRLACLESTRQELESLVKLLSGADAKIAQSALRAVYAMPLPATCTEEASRTFATVEVKGELRSRLAVANRALAEASALGLVGKSHRAIDVIEEALPKVRAIPHRRIEAQLLQILGACRFQLAETTLSIEAYEAAFLAAEAAGAGAVAAKAAAQMAFDYGALYDAKNGQRWLAVARAILERLGTNDDVEVEILNAELLILRADGHPEKTIALYDRAIELSRRQFGPWTMGLANILNNKSNAFADMGQPAAAAAELRSALEIGERVVGKDNPNLGIFYNNLGSSLTVIGQFDEAKAALEHALAFGAKYGDEASMVLPFISLAQLYNRMDNASGTLDATKRALAIVMAKGQNGRQWLPWLLVEQGRARLKLGDAAGSEVDCSEALALQEKKGIAADRVYIPDSLTCLAEAEMALGKLPAAVAHLERSVSLERRDDLADLALARFALARALHMTPDRAPERVQALTTRARDDLRTLPGRAAELATVGQWLATNGAAPR